MGGNCRFHQCRRGPRPLVEGQEPDTSTLVIVEVVLEESHERLMFRFVARL